MACQKAFNTIFFMLIAKKSLLASNTSLSPPTVKTILNRKCPSYGPVHNGKLIDINGEKL